jgi:hypothetical protein
MPIHFTIDHAKRFVDARAEGVVELKDIEAFTDAIIAQDALPYRKLFDGRLAIGKYNNDDVMMLGARVSAYASMGARGALALVAADEDALELASRFMNLGKEGRPAKAFLSIDEARKWLEAQPES